MNPFRAPTPPPPDESHHRFRWLLRLLPGTSSSSTTTRTSTSAAVAATAKQPPSPRLPESATAATASSCGNSSADTEERSKVSPFHQPHHHLQNDIPTAGSCSKSLDRTQKTFGSSTFSSADVTTTTTSYVQALKEFGAVCFAHTWGNPFQRSITLIGLLALLSLVLFVFTDRTEPSHDSSSTSSLSLTGDGPLRTGSATARTASRGSRSRNSSRSLVAGGKPLRLAFQCILVIAPSEMVISVYQSPSSPPSPPLGTKRLPLENAASGGDTSTATTSLASPKGKAIFLQLLQFTDWYIPVYSRNLTQFTAHFITTSTSSSNGSSSSSPCGGETHGYVLREWIASAWGLSNITVKVEQGTGTGGNCSPLPKQPKQQNSSQPRKEV